MLKRHFINLLLYNSPEVTLLLWKREYPMKPSWLVSHSRQNHSFPFNRERGFPGGVSGKEPACSAGDAGEDPLEEGMAIYSSILAWRIPWREEPGRLQAIGSQRVSHDWSNLARMHLNHIPLSTVIFMVTNLLHWYLQSCTNAKTIFYFRFSCWAEGPVWLVILYKGNGLLFRILKNGSNSITSLECVKCKIS